MCVGGGSRFHHQLTLTHHSLVKVHLETLIPRWNGVFLKTDRQTGRFGALKLSYTHRQREMTCPLPYSHGEVGKCPIPHKHRRESRVTSFTPRFTKVQVLAPQIKQAAQGTKKAMTEKTIRGYHTLKVIQPAQRGTKRHNYKVRMSNYVDLFSKGNTFSSVSGVLHN